MGLKVTASEAGQLVNRHERIVRGHIKRGTLPAVKHGNAWRVDVDDLERIPGWRIDRARLALAQERDARSVASMAARIDTLEREVAALRTRLYTLEAQNGRQARQDDRQTAWSDADMPSTAAAAGDYPSALYAVPVVTPTPALRMRHTSMGDVGAFDTRATAARWLVTHGVNSEGTPKSWPGWREMEPLTPSRVLELAIHLREEADRQRNHRVTWRLHECSDPACVCHELLG